MKKANERLPSGITRAQCYAFEKLARAIAKHLELPACDDEKCFMHNPKDKS